MGNKKICENCQFFRNISKKYLQDRYGRCIHPLFLDYENGNVKNPVIIFGSSIFPDERGLIVKKDFSCQLFEFKKGGQNGSNII